MSYEAPAAAIDLTARTAIDLTASIKKLTKRVRR
jgi:hypothetical protein